MTLANAERLLKHYEDTEQTERARKQALHIKYKLIKIKANINNPNLPYIKYASQFPEWVVDETKNAKPKRHKR